MASLRLVIASLLALLALAGAPSASAIVDGEPDNDPAHHFTVFVGLQGSACSGVLVSPTRVVTAAHCALRQDGSMNSPQMVVVRRGSNFRAGFQQVVGQFVAHSGFSFGGDGRPHFARNDIAIVRLLSGTLPGPYAQLPEADGVDGLKPGTPLDVIGYGVSELHGNDPLVESFDGQRRIDHGRLLGGGVRNGFFSFLGGACFADSGGFVGDASSASVYGVVSFAPSGCRSTTEATSLDTDAARAFLASHGVALP